MWYDDVLLLLLSCCCRRCVRAPQVNLNYLYQFTYIAWALPAVAVVYDNGNNWLLMTLEKTGALYLFFHLTWLRTSSKGRRRKKNRIKSKHLVVHVPNPLAISPFLTKRLDICVRLCFYLLFMYLDFFSCYVKNKFPFYFVGKSHLTGHQLFCLCLPTRQRRARKLLMRFEKVDVVAQCMRGPLVPLPVYVCMSIWLWNLRLKRKKKKKIVSPIFLPSPSCLYKRVTFFSS